MTPHRSAALLAGLACLVLLQISAEACRGTAEFCQFYSSLDVNDQAIVNELIDDVQQSLRRYQKRGDFTKKAVEPNFLRFGKRAMPAANANFLRFGKSGGVDPNFLRFGKRSAAGAALAEPNFLRFGKADPAALNNNFLRFGRALPKFERDQRQSNNFLRFG